MHFDDRFYEILSLFMHFNGQSLVSNDLKQFCMNLYSEKLFIFLFERANVSISERINGFIKFENIKNGFQGGE